MAAVKFTRATGAISAMLKSTAAIVMTGDQRTLTDVVTTNASIALVTEVALRLVQLISVRFCLTRPRPGAFRFAGVECETGEFLDRNARGS